MRVDLEEFRTLDPENKLKTVRAAADSMKETQSMAANYATYLSANRRFDDNMLFIMYESMYAFYAKAEWAYATQVAQKAEKVQEHIKHMQAIDEAEHQQADEELMAELEGLEE